eukprot:7040849-Karenia_brevis.AAC.1
MCIDHRTHQKEHWELRGGAKMSSSRLLLFLTALAVFSSTWISINQLLFIALQLLSWVGLSSVVSSAFIRELWTAIAADVAYHAISAKVQPSFLCTARFRPILLQPFTSIFRSRQTNEELRIGSAMV